MYASHTLVEMCIRDRYNRTTSDILTTANLPATLGADAPYENMGTIQTKGDVYKRQVIHGQEISVGIIVFNPIDIAGTFIVQPLAY